MRLVAKAPCPAGSLSARRAWIEITQAANGNACGGVALRKESVDRNRDNVVGRGQHYKVALRKESVDRNRFETVNRTPGRLSLSARRAWIEIGIP